MKMAPCKRFFPPFLLGLFSHGIIWEIVRLAWCSNNGGYCMQWSGGGVGPHILSSPSPLPPLAKAMCLKLPELLMFVAGGGKSKANAQVPVE